MWEVGVTDVESLVDGFVGDGHGGPIEHSRERSTESNRSDNVLLRFWPVVRIPRVIGSVPV